LSIKASADDQSQLSISYNSGPLFVVEKIETFQVRPRKSHD